MTNRSVPADSVAAKGAAEEVPSEVAAPGDAEPERSGDEAQPPATSQAPDSAAASAAKKKKSKKRKLKSALGAQKEEGEASKAASSKSPVVEDKALSNEQFKQLLEMNPALKSEMEGRDPEKVMEMLKKLSIGDLLTGAAPGKNRKDTASHKFWKTQPVTKFEESGDTAEDGPIQEVDPEKVRQTPYVLPEGFEWVTMDIEDQDELKEVYELLSHHYVEDNESMFRFNYSPAFFEWALKPPGWRKDWHVGVRVSQSRKLVAFISAIPLHVRVRQHVLNCSEVNFLCAHKKIRNKRLAPMLIREITRRCHLVGVYQAVYTSGTVIPTPISTCRYFHRSLNWEKLYEVGFCGLPNGSTVQRQIVRYRLPSHTSTKGLRPMREEDLEAVLGLLKRYLDRVAVAHKFTKEEAEHWLLHKSDSNPEQVVWAYVVEDPETRKITDFFSYYILESTAIGKNETVRAAYLFYYATEAAFDQDKNHLRKRLNALVHDALTLAKEANFDVFNALTLLDNPLFLEEQKFGAGDGHLNYYLFNWRTNPIPGGINEKSQVDLQQMGGIGLVML